MSSDNLFSKAIAAKIAANDTFRDAYLASVRDDTLSQQYASIGYTLPTFAEYMSAAWKSHYENEAAWEAYIISNEILENDSIKKSQIDIALSDISKSAILLRKMSALLQVSSL